VFFRTFGWAVGASAVALAASATLWGPTGFGVVLILAILEISLSFDNAVVNATVLRRMPAFWQKLFLTLGVLIAVFGMRLVFPLLVVGATAQIGPKTAIELALDPHRTYHGLDYAQHLQAAHPAIAAFGGMFLLMIFLNFLISESEYAWLKWIENPLQRFALRSRSDGRLPVVFFALLVLGAVVVFLRQDGIGTGTVAIAGISGLAAFLLVEGASNWFESSAERQDEETAEAKEGAEEGAEGGGRPAAGSGRGTAVAGRAAFLLFVYLEVLDATFSFDGVVGAFAVSQEIFQIAVGLGIGAMFIRSLTVYLVRQGTLDEYVYLEHGAHYAIGALAVVLLIGIKYQVPEIVTGLIGVCFIAVALWSSVRLNRRDARAAREREWSETRSAEAETEAASPAEPVDAAPPGTPRDVIQDAVPARPDGTPHGA
jgi:hypothetical protein